MCGKLDQVRVADMHNPTTHMHEGCMLDEVLCKDGGVEDGWVDADVVSVMEGWEVVEECVGMMGCG